MPKIFISYRRDDSQYQADRLHLALKKHVSNPRRDIFIDIDNIPVGVDFVAHLDAKVAECDVLLALIGPDWLDARDPQTGKRRLDDPADFVRIEIASALKRGIPVAPVLLDGASFPPLNELPDDLKTLTRRNGVEVRRASFDTDAERMIRGLRLKELGRKPAPAPPPKTERGRSPAAWIVSVVALGVIAAGAAGAWLADPFGWRVAPATIGSGVEPQSTAARIDPVPPSSTLGNAAEPVGPGAPLNAEPGASPPASAPPPSASTAVAPAPAAAKPAPRVIEKFRDCSSCPEMAKTPAGNFLMGAPKSLQESENAKPQHRVTIGYSFAMATLETTLGDWNKCVSAGVCRASHATWYTDPALPVGGVTWLEAKVYTDWLSRESGKPYRLPTEAEWEYAARAGTTTPFWTGARLLPSQARYQSSPGVEMVAAGSYPPNPFGLHDTAGNVFEWVEDCWAAGYTPQHLADGSAYVGGPCTYRVFRGGSFFFPAGASSSTSRLMIKPDDWAGYTGFRVARSLP